MTATLLALAMSANAQSWSSFGNAFPAFPCHDGWMACVVGGDKLDPELKKDQIGMVVPADMRIGWFDLKPTAAFSPFAELSRYSGSAPAVAAAEPVPEPEPDPNDAVAVASAEADEDVRQASAAADQAAADQEAARAAEADARRQADDSRREADAAERQRREADEARKRATEEEVRQRRQAEELAAAARNADAASQARLRAEAEAAQRKANEAEAARKAAEAESARRATAEEQARLKADQEAKARADAEAARQRAEAETKARQEQEAQARAQAEEQARLKAEQDRARAEQEARAKAEADAAAKAKTPAPTTDGTAAAEPAGGVRPAATPVDDGSCSDIIALEPNAMLGRLTDGQVGCLEASIGTAERQTDKKKISLVLLANAWAKGDKKTWETLMKRHLDEIDSSDPDLCYRYALHLSQGGAGRASGVIRWANEALENRTVWTGETYTQRVFSLYKMRAAASQALWASAETEHSTSPSEESKAKVDKYRSMTKVNAREWYEYAKQAGKDTTTALQLCMSAAGTADYCEAQ